MSKLEEVADEKLYRKWKLWSKIDSVFTFTALILSPVSSLFVDRDFNMPGWLKWIQTVDSTMNGGGWAGDRSLGGGDGGFYEKWNGWYQKKPCWWKRVVICFMWQWRNPAQGFSYHVLGRDLPEEWYIYQSPESTRDYWETGTRNEYEGWYYVEVRDKKTDEVVMFQFYEVQKYDYTADKYAHRQNYGWKLNTVDKPLWKGRCMIVSSNNPIKSL